MNKTNRREFLTTMGAAAAGIAAAGDTAMADTLTAYRDAVRSEPSLLAFWPLEVDLAPATGGAAGEAHGGATSFASGPLGAKALNLDGGRFVGFGVVPGLDTPEATVELFFTLPSAPGGAYNPCLVAQRSSSPDTRFSVHVMSDLSVLAVWNGHAVTNFAASDGPIKVGRWYHLAVVSSASGLLAYVDGVPCALPAGSQGFNLEQKDRPLQVGASSPAGEEACICGIAEVALYGATLPAARIFAHVDSAGWAERRKRLAEEQRLAAEKQAKARRAKLEARLNDPRLFARGEQRIYKGANLTGISFTLGGIGAGCIQTNGKAERAIWQIFNNFHAGQVPNSFFAIGAKPSGGPAVIRALQTSAVGPFKGMSGLTFRGEFPFAWYDFEDAALPVKVSLEAFTPMIPHKAKESAIPCAVFNVTVRNTSRSTVEANVLGVQQNVIGYLGTGTILDKSFSAYGGNSNRLLEDRQLAILHMTSGREAADPAYGDMALVAMATDAVGVASIPSVRELHAQLVSDKYPDGPKEAGPSPAGATIDGTVSAAMVLKPGETRTVTFALVWHFPNAKHGGDIGGWDHAGNMYANWWGSALDIAHYLAEGLPQLTKETRLFHDTLYKSDLPHWLLDRITSQLAVLRSKTCFWAKDDYFGAWEGCAPDNGCCAGCCTHVWHYAQAHARLFPELARRMRKATYGYQKPDGSLPHRHPSLPPATDGQLGDILGAYREHLLTTDNAWVHELWPKVKKAMEHSIRTWDPDEDGVLSGAQWNTLDDNLGGSTSWMGTLYCAALAASERMATIEGDRDAAARYRRIRASGAKKQNATLFDGEYYMQVRDAEPHRDYGDGCHIDQLLGEWWARQVDLPTAYPADRRLSALKSIVKYNFKPDFHGIVQVPRKFVDDGDAGTQMITWPKGPRPVPTMLYGDECMTGFEYAAAANMVQNGLVREGFLVALAISDRYDGRLRPNLTPGGSASWGFSGNPFGDDECGKFYARAMSVWSLLPACQGLVHDGPAGVIGFKPVWKPESHRSFFTSAEGWGLYEQKRTGTRLAATIHLTAGRLNVKKIVLQVAPGHTPTRASLQIAGKPAAATMSASGADVTVTPRTASVVEAGQKVTVVVT